MKQFTCKKKLNKVIEYVHNKNKDQKQSNYRIRIGP